jgi:carbon-monoxide dehydrogenase medium subunit
MWEDFIIPSTIDEALRVLIESGGRARVLAGGTDLILQLREGQTKTDCVVYVKEIDSLHGIKAEDGRIRLGAAVTHAEVAESGLIRRTVPALVEACCAVGSPQIRNQGTVVGNVVNAAPAADAAAVLFTLGAELEVVGSDGLRILAIDDAYVGLMESRIDSTQEIVQAVRFPIPPDHGGSAFVRISHRKSLCLPVLNGGFYVEIKNGMFSKAVIALGPVAPVPFRATEAEKTLVSNRVTPEIIETAASVASEEANPRDSLLRGSREIRKAMVKGLVIRGLETAVGRAGES